MALCQQAWSASIEYALQGEMVEVTSARDNLAAIMRSAGTGTSAAGSASGCSLALAAALPAGLLLAVLALSLAVLEPAGLSSLSTSTCPVSFYICKLRRLQTVSFKFWDGKHVFIRSNHSTTHRRTIYI